MSVLMYLQEYKRTDELDKSRAVVSLANSAIVYIALDRAHFGERAVSLGWVVLREDCSAYWCLDHIVHGRILILLLIINSIMRHWHATLRSYGFANVRSFSLHSSYCSSHIFKTCNFMRC